MSFYLNVCFAASLLLLVISQLSFGYHISPRIANGHNAIPHSAPYIISLQVMIKGTPKHSCGGAILNENWILTAGHCLKGMNVSEMLIQAGRHNIQLTSEPTEQRRKIHWYKIHDKYGGNVEPNDLALIYVKEPFIWTEAVQSIALPKSEKIHSGIATLFGWGLLQNTINKIILATILQTADIPILPIDKCMHDFHYEKYLDLTNICTFDENGTGICSSDSGGPLVQMSMENKMEIIGIVSWGPAICGLPNKSVSVYVQVSSFIDWIDNVKSEFENVKSEYDK